MAATPADQRARAASAALPGLWWALWLLAWITSFQHEATQVTHGSTTDITSIYALNFGGTTLSAVFAAAAAIVLIMIIRTVSAGPVGLPPTPNVLRQAAGTVPPAETFSLCPCM
jgi:hypothetical protein